MTDISDRDFDALCNLTYGWVRDDSVASWDRPRLARLLELELVERVASAGSIWWYSSKAGDDLIRARNAS